MTGSGTVADPYIITTRADLEAVNDDLTAYYELGADISLAGSDWLPIGWDATYENEAEFAGQLDGKNHKISGMTITLAVEAYDIGLFADVGGIIKNLSLCGFSVDANVGYPDAIGGIAGSVRGAATFDHCTASGSIDTEGGNIGSIIGTADTQSDYAVTVEFCRGTLSVTGNFGSRVGGLIGNVGTNVSLLMTDCYGSLTCREGGNPSYVGGLIGYVYGLATIVRGEGVVNIDLANGSAIGGLIGNATVKHTFTMTDCKASGSIVSNSGGNNSQYIGGCIGLIGFTGTYAADIERCMSSVDVSGYSSIGGFCGVASLTSGTEVIKDCYAIGDVTADAANGVAGGFIGGITSAGFDVDNCYSVGAVIGRYAGGWNWTGGYGVTSCYWDTQTSGQATSTDGVGKTTAQMQTQSTFVGWDFDAVWNIASGTYPFLRTAFVTLVDKCAKPIIRSFPWVGKFSLTRV